MQGIYEIGPFRLEVRERRLLRSGHSIALRAKVFDTLRVLVENHGKLVSKDEMLRSVWPDAVVEEGNLAHNLTVLRKALGDKDTGQQHVETVPGKGYRFIGVVRLVPEGAAQPEPPSRPSWEQRLEIARAALASKCAGAAIEDSFPGHV